MCGEFFGGLYNHIRNKKVSKLYLLLLIQALLFFPSSTPFKSPINLKSRNHTARLNITTVDMILEKVPDNNLDCGPNSMTNLSAFNDSENLSAQISSQNNKENHSFNIISPHNDRQLIASFYTLIRGKPINLISSP